MPDIVIDRAIRKNPRITTRVAAAAAAALLAPLIIWALRPTSAVPTARVSDLWIATVEEGPLSIVVSAAGTFQPLEQRWLTVVEPGTVESVKVQPGDAVMPDTVLAVLVSPAVIAAQQQAEAGVASAQAARASLHAQLTGQLLTLQAGLASAQLAADSNSYKEQAERPLVESHVISVVDYTTLKMEAHESARLAELAAQQLTVFKDSMNAQEKASTAQIAALEAVLESTRDRVRALSIRAGIQGVVQEVTVHAGQTLSLGNDIARVASQKELKVTLAVPANEANEVVNGQSVSLELASDTEHHLSGRIVRLSPAVDNGTVEADVRLDGALPSDVRPNLAVTGEIHVADMAHTLYVQRPAYAGPRSGTTLYRLTEDGHSALATHVVFGAASDHYIQINSGLKTGDRVIASDTGGFAAAPRISLR